MWLQALLPRYIPTARIMAFTYGIVADRSSNILSAEGLAQAAHTLLEDYSLMRAEEEASSSPKWLHSFAAFNMQVWIRIRKFR